MSRSHAIEDDELDTDKVAGLVAYNIRRLRRKSGWSVEECCDESGIAVPVWYRIESADLQRGNFQSIDLAADLFGVHVTEMFRRPRK